MNVDQKAAVSVCKDGMVLVDGTWLVDGTEDQGAANVRDGSGGQLHFKCKLWKSFSLYYPIFPFQDRFVGSLHFVI